jgi:hypothetical protein
MIPIPIFNQTLTGTLTLTSTGQILCKLNASLAGLLSVVVPESETQLQCEEVISFTWKIEWQTVWQTHGHVLAHHRDTLLITLNRNLLWSSTRLRSMV